MKFEPAAWPRQCRDAIAAFLANEKVRAAWDWLKEPVITVLAVFVFVTIVVQPFYVPSGSMEPTLAIGDAVLAAKFPYGYSRYSIPFVAGPSPESRLFGHLPTVGDVIVFRLPRETSVTYVKRLIGLPGDRIQMIEGRLWINGHMLPLREAGTGQDEMSDGSDLDVPKYIETLPGGREHPIFKRQWDGPLDNTQVYTVPPGYVFMMGDNRDDSLDSRVPADEGGVGFVPLGNLVGRAFVVIGSVDFLNAETIFGWITEFRFSRLLHHVH